MKKSLIYAIILLSLYSCGSYTYTTNRGYEIKSVLAITEVGDTVSVPYREFVRYRDTDFVRYRFNNNWYWNNWRYNDPYFWNSYYSWNSFGSWNWNWWYNDHYYYDIAPRTSPRPRAQPTPRPKPRTPESPAPREPKPRLRDDQIIRINPRSNQPSQGRNNGRRSWSREVVPSQPTQPRQPRAVQPRQIRRGSGSPVLQQSRSSQRSSGEGRTSSSRRQN